MNLKPITGIFSPLHTYTDQSHGYLVSKKGTPFHALSLMTKRVLGAAQSSWQLC